MRRFFGQLLLLLVFVGNQLTTSIVVGAENKSKRPAVRNVRVTTGIVEVHGWEQGLIKGNPNLARWHWDPIYSYKQGYAKIAPVAPKPSNGQMTNTTGKPGKSTFNYPAHNDVKPSHIPYSPQAMAEVQARLSQPPKPETKVNAVLQEEKVSGSLRPSTEPSIATYGQVYSHKVNNSLDTAANYHSQKTDVYGKLVDVKSNKGNKSNK